MMQQIIDRCRTCICCKALEHIIVSNMNKHLAFESILADSAWFPKSEVLRNPTGPFYHDMVSHQDRALNGCQRQTDFIIIKFAKDFDKEPHRRLLYKLNYYGIRGSTHKWISPWLSERSQKIVLDGQVSDPVRVLSGVPKGSVLGRVFFLIFINGLPENIRSSVRLFVDDCVLYRNINSPKDCHILQDDLNSLAQWETHWQMKFNAAKFHSMRVTRHLPDNQIQFEYSLHQQKLEQV